MGVDTRDVLHKAATVAVCRRGAGVALLLLALPGLLLGLR